MSDYTVKGNDLTAIADAIRTKGETSASLAFPDGFVSAIGDIDTSGESTLITKSVTANGTYKASNDNADGYSAVTVAVPVPTNHVTGTFTGTTKGAAMTVSIPYAGNGYPIQVIVYPSGGPYNSATEYYQTVQRYAECWFVACKCDSSVPPNFSTQNDDANNFAVMTCYKSSDSDATAYTRGGGMGSKTTNPHVATANSGDCLRFNSATSMSVFIANTSYGFMADIEYTYDIVYSE